MLKLNLCFGFMYLFNLPHDEGVRVIGTSVFKRKGLLCLRPASKSLCSQGWSFMSCGGHGQCWWKRLIKCRLFLLTSVSTHFQSIGWTLKPFLIWCQAKGCTQWHSTHRDWAPCALLAPEWYLWLASLRKMPGLRGRATGATTSKGQVKSCIQKGGTHTVGLWQRLPCVYFLWEGYQPDCGQYLWLFISHIMFAVSLSSCMFQP